MIVSSILMSCYQYRVLSPLTKHNKILWDWLQELENFSLPKASQTHKFKEGSYWEPFDPITSTASSLSHEVTLKRKFRFSNHVYNIMCCTDEFTLNKVTRLKRIQEIDTTTTKKNTISFFSYNEVSLRSLLELFFFSS